MASRSEWHSLVYDELRRIAAAKIAHELPGQTLTATALVHEAYLRIGAGQAFETKAHFFAAAAEAMRRILIEAARRRNAIKRGGAIAREECEIQSVAAPVPDDDLLALHDALEQFAQVDPAKAELVSLRYFAGLTSAEAAEVLGISPSTADRQWAYARAWLKRAIDATK
jgi:RNA polymerase sigma factor (TIGR02999 family)